MFVVRPILRERKAAKTEQQKQQHQQSASSSRSSSNNRNSNTRIAAATLYASSSLSISYISWLLLLLRYAFPCFGQCVELICVQVDILNSFAIIVSHSNASSSCQPFDSFVVGFNVFLSLSLSLIFFAFDSLLSIAFSISFTLCYVVHTNPIAPIKCVYWNSFRLSAVSPVWYNTALVRSQHTKKKKQASKHTTLRHTDVRLYMVELEVYLRQPTRTDVCTPPKSERYIQFNNTLARLKYLL